MKKRLAFCLALALLLSGCTATQAGPTQQDDPPDETEPAATEPLVVKETGDFGLSFLPEYGMNPYTCAATVNRAAFSLLYESLFVVSNQFRAEPVLCDSFRVSEDGMTYTVTLLSDVRFSDGTPLTAEDAAASLQAARQSDLYSGRLAHVSSVSAEGSDLIVRLDTPYENFALMLDVPIVKATTVEFERPTGTGAYRLSGNRLVRNTYWWQTQTPAVTAEIIPLTPASTPNELRDSFEFGGTDLIYCDPNSVASSGYRCDYEAWESPSTVMHYIGFNVSSGYFTNDTLRTAVTFAIDRDRLANEIYGGFAQASVLPCSPASDLYDDQLAENYDFAPSQFIAAVNNSEVTTSQNYAGHVGVFLVCSDDPKRVAAAEDIAETLNEAGLSIVINALDRESYFAALENSEFDLYYGEVRLTANFDLSEFFSRNGDLQYGSVANTGLAALCISALQNSGSYFELCEQLLQTAPICPVVFKSYAIYVTRGMIATITPAVDYVFHNSATARTLADADKTYEPTDTSDGADTTDEPTEAGETTDEPTAAPD